MRQWFYQQAVGVAVIKSNHIKSNHTLKRSTGCVCFLLLFFFFCVVKLFFFFCKSQPYLLFISYSSTFLTINCWESSFIGEAHSNPENTSLLLHIVLLYTPMSIYWLTRFWKIKKLFLIGLFFVDSFCQKTDITGWMHFFQ